MENLAAGQKLEYLDTCKFQRNCDWKTLELNYQQCITRKPHVTWNFSWKPTLSLGKTQLICYMRGHTCIVHPCEGILFHYDHQWAFPRFPFALCHHLKSNSNILTIRKSMNQGSYLICVSLVNSKPVMLYKSFLP